MNDLYTNRDLTYTTRQGSRVSCLAQTAFAAFGKGVQLISGSSYAETEQLSEINLAKRYTCHLMMISNSLDLGGCGKTLLTPRHSLNGFSDTRHNWTGELVEASKKYY